MHISKFRLIDYKSFRESGELNLSPGINVVVGQNNVGKTALLEGLSLRFSSKPHRGPGGENRRATTQSEQSRARVTFTVSREEFWSLLRGMSGSFAVPLPDQETLFKSNDDEMLSEKEHVRRFVVRLLSQEYFDVEAEVRANDNREPIIAASRFPAVGGYTVANDGHKWTFAVCEINEEGLAVRNVYGEERTDIDFGLAAARELTRRVYGFRAERPASGPHPEYLNAELLPDASNLATVLSQMQSTPHRFRQLIRDLNYVLPQVSEVTTRGVGNQQRPGQLDREVLVFGPETVIEGIPLSDSGTGVSQVLSMLSILVAANHPRVIAIDEPQSFLHPGAVRKLFEVFARYPQHQYVISTHVPNVIAAAKSPTITLVTKPSTESEFRAIDAGDVEQLRLALHEVGARLSDVFGADRILWVEGSTERDCFPLIIGTLKPRRLMGTEFVPVLGTDETVGKDADRVIRIYERLSQGRGLLPPAVGFIFDRECRDEARIVKLESRFAPRLKFTGRRMYENYLLDPKAIEAVLLEAGLDGSRVSAEAIERWMSEEVNKRGYFCPRSRQREPWVEHVDAAKLLGNLFTYFSDATLGYEDRKVEYGVKLTRWVLDHYPDTLAEVAELIDALLPEETQMNL